MLRSITTSQTGQACTLPQISQDPPNPKHKSSSLHSPLTKGGEGGQGGNKNRKSDRAKVEFQSNTQKPEPPATWLQTLLSDFRIIFERDPAARNWLEVLCCYPGLHAVWLHRLAHSLHSRRVRFIPRLISHLSRFLTGIEIHPGAVLGRGVFIDHGMGVVIGETAIVGDYSLIYQGVTLGGTGKESGKRHPTLGKNVVVGAGAKVLGNIEIGDNVRVGAGSILLRDIPENSTVVGVPGRIVRRSSERVCPLEHGQLPDTEAAAIRALVDRIERLEQQLQTLQHTSDRNDVYTI